MNSFLLLIIFTLLSGLFAMTEIALSSSKKIKLELSAKRGSRGAKAALALIHIPNIYLSIGQIGITLVTLAIGMVGGEAYAEKIAPYIAPIPFIGVYAHEIASVLNIFFVAFISIAFGEMIPKRIGLAKPEAVAEIMAIPFLWISRVGRPFVWLLSRVTELFMNLLGVKMDASKVTEEEIKAMIDEGATTGAIEEIEQDIVENVFHLGDKKVSSLMSHRSDIIWLDVNEPNEVNLAKIQKYGHAVYPVCEDELDNVQGIVNVKDLFAALLQNEKIDFRKMVRKVNYFPETMSAYAALEKFKESKIHQGLVVDEYGSMVGIVTINDVFDTLVGDISEADGQISYEMFAREDGTWLIDGQYPWDDFLKEFDVDDDSHTREGFHTISGFVLHILGELPRTGEIIKWNSFTLEVVEMDGLRIDKILIKREL
jgi:putative hemolysin